MLNDDFLLQSDIAARLYHKIAAELPIIDYHCHLNPQMIAEDRAFSSVTELFLGGDHYKWRLMRTNGVPEREITDPACEPWTRFLRLAETLPKALGNPVYVWTHLELKRYFGVDIALTPSSARAIYDECNAQLTSGSFTPRSLIERSNVRLLCTTDNPLDDLAWHDRLQSWNVRVLPAFRPDAWLNDAEFGDFELVERRLEHFAERSCRTADHGFESLRTLPNARVLTHLAKRYRELGWVMQLHVGARRNLNSKMRDWVGADTGFDAIHDSESTAGLAEWLDSLAAADALPKTIIYSLNPNDSELIQSIAGCFRDVRLGAAWWFNDTRSGIERQLRDTANGSLLGNFVGMLTDSRSFLSYPRHEYFRRILCNFVGECVRSGEYPADFDALAELVRAICVTNVNKFFGFEVQL